MIRSCQFWFSGIKRRNIVGGNKQSLNMLFSTYSVYPFFSFIIFQCMMETICDAKQQVDKAEYKQIL